MSSCPRSRRVLQPSVISPGHDCDLAIWLLHRRPQPACPLGSPPLQERRTCQITSGHTPRAVLSADDDGRFSSSSIASQSGVNVNKHDDEQVQEGADDAQHGQDGFLLLLLGLQRLHVLQGDHRGAHGPGAQLTWQGNTFLEEMMETMIVTLTQVEDKAPHPPSPRGNQL